MCIVMICRLPRFLFAVAIAGPLLLLPGAAMAANLSDMQLQTIRQNCTSAQLTLQQLQRRDAVSRINRGRSYDQMLRQVSAFSSRLAYNNVSLSQMTQLAGDLQVTVDRFRAAYTQYDASLSSTIKIDCKNKASEFYELIGKTSNARAAVASEVSHIEVLNARYRDGLVAYQATLPQDSSQTEAGQ